MKPILAIAFSLVSMLATTAQLKAATRPSNPGSASPILLEAEGKSARIISFATVQSPSNGAVAHEITATVDMGNAIDVVAFLAGRMSDGGRPPRPFPMTLTYLSSSGTATEVRDYRDVTVAAIELPGFDASSKSGVQLVIRMKALGLTTTPGGEKVASKIQGKAKQVAQANYSMKVGDLPSQRISRISSMQLIPCAQGSCASLTPFEIWMSGTDATPWREWFEQSVADPNLSKSGEILILAANLRDVIATIGLRDVRPTSYADVTTATGIKGHVGLRVGQVKVKFQ